MSRRQWLPPLFLHGVLQGTPESPFPPSCTKHLGSFFAFEVSNFSVENWFVLSAEGTLLLRFGWILFLLKDFKICVRY